MPIVAVIDIGTNSVRLDIRALRGGSRWELLVRKKEVIRLGRSVFTAGIIDGPSEQALFENLDRFQKKIRSSNADEVVCVGTSALREAQNSAQILAEITRRYGFTVEIISGDREAQLIARGIVENEPNLQSSFVLIDIGGGSTEVTAVRDGEVLRSTSLPLGALRLQETFLKSSPPVESPAEGNSVAALRAHVAQTLQQRFPLIPGAPPLPLVGSSGTVKALGRLFGVLPGDDAQDDPIATSSGAESLQYRRSDVEAFVVRALPMTRQELERLPGLDKKRAEVILAGALLLESLMHYFQAETIRVSDYSLRDGLYEEFLRTRYSAR